MTTIAIRKKLVDYLQVAEDKKIKAMYALLEDDIEQEALEYTGELKAKLDNGYIYYKSRGKMVSATEADKRINKILSPGKRK